MAYKYTKYTVVKEFGKYYIEIPFWIFFKTRIGYWKHHEVGTTSHNSFYYYEFDTYQEASDFAYNHKYEEFI